MGGMAIPRSWQGEAFNQSRESENRIHSDEVAREYGFKGGLVPGVTVSAYLIHPGVEAWGLDWLTRGRASVMVGSPLYDGRPFRVEVSEATECSYRAVLLDEEGGECATATVELPESLPPPPEFRGDPRIDEDYERPPGTRDVMEELRGQAMRALRARWDALGGRRVTIFRSPADAPEPEDDEIQLVDAEGRYGALLGRGERVALVRPDWMIVANVPRSNLEAATQRYLAQTGFETQTPPIPATPRELAMFGDAPRAAR